MATVKLYLKTGDTDKGLPGNTLVSIRTYACPVSYNRSMNIFDVLLVSLGLAMDAFAVAVASGATMQRLNLPYALKMGLFFGGFQMLMPVLGWLAGLGMKDFISGVDHWIAFGLLMAIGCKMLYEAFAM